MSSRAGHPEIWSVLRGDSEVREEGLFLRVRDPSIRAGENLRGDTGTVEDGGHVEAVPLEKVAMQAHLDVGAVSSSSEVPHRRITSPLPPVANSLVP